MRIGFPSNVMPQFLKFLLFVFPLAFESCQGGELNIFYPFV